MHRGLTILAASIVAFSPTTVALAGPGHFYGPPAPHGRPHRPPWDGWIVPLATGAVLGAAAVSAPRTVIVQRTASVPVQPVSQTSGTVYKRVEIYIPECKCYRTYDVPIN